MGIYLLESSIYHSKTEAMKEEEKAKLIRAIAQEVNNNAVCAGEPHHNSSPNHFRRFDGQMFLSLAFLDVDQLKSICKQSGIKI